MHGRAPLTNLSSVIGGTKDELRSAIVARADIRDIGLVRNQNLGATKVAELEDAGIWIEQKVLRLDITMTDTLGVDVRKRAEKLVDVDFDLEDGHGSLHLVEKA